MLKIGGQVISSCINYLSNYEKISEIKFLILSYYSKSTFNKILILLFKYTFKILIRRKEVYVYIYI